MKPSSTYCQYCELNEDCQRANCARKAIFKNDIVVMVEPKLYNKIRSNELTRVYKEVPLTKKELLTKY